MTDTSMTLMAYLRKIGVDLDGDFLREGARLVTQMAMRWRLSSKLELRSIRGRRRGPTSAMDIGSGIGTRE